MQRGPAAHAASVPVQGRSEVPSLIQLVYIVYSARLPNPEVHSAPRRGFASPVRSLFLNQYVTTTGNRYLHSRPVRTHYRYSTRSCSCDSWS